MITPKFWKGDRCFACNKPLFSNDEGLLNARSAFTRDGEYHIVGGNCARKASAMTIHGYQAIDDGPRIFTTMLNLCEHPEHGGEAYVPAEKQS